MGTTPITVETLDADQRSMGRPFGALADAAAALRPAQRPEPPASHSHSHGYEEMLAAAADALTGPADDDLGQLLAAATDTLDADDRCRAPSPVGGTLSTALVLAEARGGSVAASDAPIELGLALRRRLARAGATTGASFDGDRLRVQPTGAADNP